MNRFAFVAFLVVALVGKANAFLVVPTEPTSLRVPSSHTTTATTALHMTLLTYNGQKKDFKAGSPLKNACAALGVKPKYSCKKYVLVVCQLCHFWCLVHCLT